ncbi:unnamed protein product [Paramecium pentaurelia]|uniref:Uncharacterized protein n=1 Tax=Paramecium pentaurelia TaxID=43138 RepID=A0A8S1W139_9CILI|nr:unnamed protein product [Paramecium pentaurelia]
MAEYQPQAIIQQPALYGAPQTVTGQPQFVRPIVLGNSTYQQQQVTNQNLGQSGFYQGGGMLVNQPVLGASAISSNIISTGQAIKGESKIEYIPYEKTIMEYEEVRRQIQVPITRQITEYQAIQYETEYIPQVIQEKVIEYMPVEKVAERVEYQTVTRQNMLQNTVQQVQQTQIQPIVTTQTYQTTTPVVQTVQKPIVTQVAQPVVQQQIVQNVPQTYYSTYQQPITTQYIQQPLAVQQTIPAPVYQSSSPRLRQSTQVIQASAPVTTTTAYAQPPVLYQASQTRVGAPIVQTQPVAYGYQPQGQQLLTYQGQVPQPNLPNQSNQPISNKQPNQTSTQTPKVSQPPQQPQANQVPSTMQQQQQQQQQQQKPQQQQPIANQQQQKQDKGFLAKLFD